MKRTWVKITIGVVGVLVLLGAVFQTSTWQGTNGGFASQFIRFVFPLLPAKPISARKPRTDQDVYADIKEDHAQGPAPIPALMEQAVHVEKQNFQGHEVEILSPKQEVPKTEIIYFHGGAYVFSITWEHWQFLEKLVLYARARVVVPMYPLAPEHKVKETLNFATDFFKSRLALGNPQKLILMGDSAGAGLALALAQQLVRLKLTQPDQILLASPWLDISMENPQINAIVPNDPVLSKSALKLEGQLYAGDVDVHDPRVSPVYGSLRGVAPITIYTGTYDILHPDSDKLKALAISEGVTLNESTYPLMMHDWFMMPVLEKASVIRNIIEQISLDH